MSAIEATSVRCKTLADDSLHLTVCIEPRHAQAAFELFRKVGTSMALAALKPAHLIDKTPEPVESEPEIEQVKGGRLAQAAGMVCDNPRFQAYAREQGYLETAEGARGLVCNFCQVSSRRFLDHDPKAAIRYGRLMAMFRDWSGAAA